VSGYLRAGRADLPTDEVRSVHYGQPTREGKRQALPTVRSNVVRRTLPLFRAPRLMKVIGWESIESDWTILLSR
jgi:hypothetical protein